MSFSPACHFPSKLLHCQKPSTSNLISVEPQIEKASGDDLQKKMKQIEAKIQIAKSQWSRLDKWSFVQQKQTGLLAWVAKLILRLFPSIKHRVNQVIELEHQLQRVQTQMKATPPLQLNLLPSSEKSLPDPSQIDGQAANRAAELTKTKIAAAKTGTAKLSDDRALKIPHLFQRLKERFQAQQAKVAKAKADKAALPATGLPATGALVTSKLVASEPVANKLVASEPVAAEPVAAEPGAAEPGATHSWFALLKAIKQLPASFDQLPPQLKNDPSFIEVAILRNSDVIQWVSKDLPKYRALALMAASKNGMALQYLDTELQNDREIVFAAVKQYGRALQFASDSLKNDLELVKCAIEKDGCVLKFASSQLQNNMQLVEAGVKQNGNALQFASRELRKNLDIAKVAVAENGFAFTYVDSSIKSNLHLALAAVKQNAHVLDSLIPLEVLKNPLFIINAVAYTELAIKYAPPVLQEHRSILLLAVNSKGKALKYAGAEIKDDKEVVMAAVKQDGLAIQYASDALQNNIEIALTAVKQNEEAFKLLSPAMQLEVEKVHSFTAAGVSPMDH